MGAESTPIYLDHAATTPVDPRVARRMADVLALPLGNAAAVHGPGLAAHALVETSRAQVAGLIGATAEDIVFTSGATESNNLAITGTARLALPRNRTSSRWPPSTSPCSNRCARCRPRG